MVSAARPHVTGPAARKGRGRGAVVGGLLPASSLALAECLSVGTSSGLRCHGTDAVSLCSDLSLWARVRPQLTDCPPAVGRLDFVGHLGCAGVGRMAPVVSSLRRPS